VTSPSGLAIHATKLNAAPSPIASALAIRPPEWTEQALCAQTDPEAFFPEKGGTTRPAKAMCATCPVRVECLEYALDNDERFGIWGGLSERERRKLKAPSGKRRRRWSG